MFQHHSNQSPPRLGKDPALKQTKNFILHPLKFDRDDFFLSYKLEGGGDGVSNDHFMRRALRSRSVPFPA